MNKPAIRALFLEMFAKGVDAAKAENCLPPFLPRDRPRGRTMVLALGKAAPAMARVALERIDADTSLIVAPYGSVPNVWEWPQSTTIIEASHPVPDENSLKAGEAAIALVRELGPDDRLIALISGGGSSLMVAPIPGLILADKQALNAALLASGAPVAEMNIIRRALSRTKGGALARAALPAETITLVISDVPGDHAGLVSSGPTVLAPDDPDANPPELARKWGISWPVTECLLSRATPVAPVPYARTEIVASARHMLAAVADVAACAGYRPILLGDDLEGEATGLANEHAALAKTFKNERVALISGGETSVAVANRQGIGGRNSTYALALAAALDGASNIAAFATDSDGIDGNSKVAGAMIFPDTCQRLRAHDCEARQLLSDNDSASAFAILGDQISSGATGTNVNDLRVMLVSG